MLKGWGASEIALFWPMKINIYENSCIWRSWLSFISVTRSDSFVSFDHLDQNLLHERYSTFLIFVKWMFIDSWEKPVHKAVSTRPGAQWCRKHHGTMPSFRRSFQPRGRTQVSRIAGGFFAVWATKEAHVYSNVTDWSSETLKEGRNVPQHADVGFVLLCFLGSVLLFFTFQAHTLLFLLQE